MAYKISATVVSNVGKIRQNNEDNYYLFGKYREDTSINISAANIKCTTENDVAAVLDGMGGEEAGEVASLLAAAGMASVLDGDWKEQISEQLIRLNERICAEMSRQQSGRMGTTFAGIYFDNDKAISANIGDSRCYLMRDKKLQLLSHDHSEAQSLIDSGSMTEEEARASKKWHVLSQCLGVFPEEFVIVPFFSQVLEVKENDRFLICSDGLTDLVLDDEISDILQASTPEVAAHGLVECALVKGGYDNVTVIVADIEQ